MADRLTDAVEPLVTRVGPLFRREAEKAMLGLQDLAPTSTDEAQPTFRAKGVSWTEVQGVESFQRAEPRMWPVYRCLVSRNLLLDEQAGWSPDSLAREMAVEASLAFARGIRDVVWASAKDQHRMPAEAAKLQEHVDGLGGRAVLVVAEGVDVSDELTAVVDDVKKVPLKLMPGAGYLRAAVNGPCIELLQAAWQVGWDRVDATAAKLVVGRAVRVTRAERAVRLIPRA